MNKQGYQPQPQWFSIIVVGENTNNASEYHHAITDIIGHLCEGQFFRHACECRHGAYHPHNKWFHAPSLHPFRQKG